MNSAFIIQFTKFTHYLNTLSCLSGLTKEDKENIGYIIADILLHKPEVCEFINTTLSHDRSIAIVSKQNKSQTKENSAFKNYFDFKCYIKHIKSHQVLAINRGEKRKELKVTVDIPDGSLEKQLERFCLNLVKAHTVCSEQIILQFWTQFKDYHSMKCHGEP